MADGQFMAVDGGQVMAVDGGQVMKEDDDHVMTLENGQDMTLCQPHDSGDICKMTGSGGYVILGEGVDQNNKVKTRKRK